MYAKFVNEVNQFQRGLEPKKAMGVGRLAQLENKYKVTLNILTPNEILIFAVAKQNAYDVAKYALEAGANQLWYKKTKIAYQDPIIPAPDFSPMFVIITKVSSMERWDNEFLHKVFYKDVSGEIFGHQIDKTIRTSSEFPSKFEPVNYKFMEILEETIKRGKQIKKYYQNNQ